MQLAAVRESFCEFCQERRRVAWQPRWDAQHESMVSGAPGHLNIAHSERGSSGPPPNETRGLPGVNSGAPVVAATPPCTAEQCDELAPHHSITSSAQASKDTLTV